MGLKTKDRHLFLFSDVLIFAKVKYEIQSCLDSNRAAASSFFLLFFFFGEIEKLSHTEKKAGTTLTKCANHPAELCQISARWTVRVKEEVQTVVLCFWTGYFWLLGNLPAWKLSPWDLKKTTTAKNTVVPFVFSQLKFKGLPNLSWSSVVKEEIIFHIEILSCKLSLFKCKSKPALKGTKNLIQAQF